MMIRIEKDTKISAFVKDIFLLENESAEVHSLPFYADGYPGILYSETAEPVMLLPMKKSLPNFFLYGQTIEPIQLLVNGAYKMLVFQLYPFATRLLLNINPKEINDACYDLMQVHNIDTTSYISKLQSLDIGEQTNLISNYVLALVKQSTVNLDTTIKLAVSTLINTKGTLPIKELREQLFITERTFERNFAKAIGVTPKQFAKIIQFSFSLHQIQETDYTTLTNIAYENGFSDQSHFIKTFKKYTGGTPKELLAQVG